MQVGIIGDQVLRLRRNKFPIGREQDGGRKTMIKQCFLQKEGAGQVNSITVGVIGRHNSPRRWAISTSLTGDPGNVGGACRPASAPSFSTSAADR